MIEFAAVVCFLSDPRLDELQCVERVIVSREEACTPKSEAVVQRLIELDGNGLVRSIECKGVNQLLIEQSLQPGGVTIDVSPE